MDEGNDLGGMQFWSENHQIGWMAGQYLIGNAFAENTELKDIIFEASGLTGAGQRDLGRERIRKWLQYRAR